MLAELFKMPAFSEILTRIAKFKLQTTIPFTIEPIKKNEKDGTRTTLGELNGLTVSRLNNSSILSIKAITKLSFCM